MSTSDLLKKLLFPRKCPFCGRILRQGPDGGVEYICSGCAQTVFMYSKADVLPHEALEKVLKLYVPLKYTGPAKDAMLRFKFGGERWIFEPFAELLHRYLEANGGYADIDLITCVPLSAARFAKRGYNQSELVARRLSEASGLPFRTLLKRTPGSGGMTSAENYAGRVAERRFAYSAATPLRGLRVLLVDDIFTTGSTLNECAGILLANGAGYVNAACMMSGRQDIYDAAREESA